jgi:hypothetical protein
VTGKMLHASAQTAPRPASKIRPRRRDGRAFELSGRYQLDDNSWTLVHGSIRAKVITKGNALTRFNHAWLKRDGWVYDSVLDKSYEEPHYVQLYAARAVATYDSRAARKMATDTGHWGPWIEIDVSEGPPEALAMSTDIMILRAGARRTDPAALEKLFKSVRDAELISKQFRENGVNFYINYFEDTQVVQCVFRDAEIIECLTLTGVNRELAGKVKREIGKLTEIGYEQFRDACARATGGPFDRVQ